MVGSSPVNPCETCGTADWLAPDRNREGVALRCRCGATAPKIRPLDDTPLARVLTAFWMLKVWNAAHPVTPGERIVHIPMYVLTLSPPPPDCFVH